MFGADWKEPDVLSDLLDEKHLVAEGDYIGIVQEVSEPQAPKTREGCYAYIRVKVTLGRSDKAVWIFISGWPAAIKFMHHALPKYVGKRVKVRVKHRQHNDQCFLDANILEWTV